MIVNHMFLVEVCRRSRFNCVGFVVQVIDAQKRDFVSICWTQGALSSDWLGQPPLTCPWPIRGECAACVFTFSVSTREFLCVCVVRVSVPRVKGFLSSPSAGVLQLVRGG